MAPSHSHLPSQTWIILGSSHWGGQYRRARDHIRERHPDAVKRGALTSTDVAPATPESSPGLFPVRPVTAAQALHQLLQQHPNHQLYLQLPDRWTLQGNHQLQLFCRTHPLEVPQRLPAQHALPLADQPEPGSLRPGFLRRCDPDCPWLTNISNISHIFQINHVTHLSLLVLRLK